MKVDFLIKALERIAPPGYQEEYDNSGLQVGFPDSEIGSVLVCLDVTEDIIDEAVRKGCGMIVSHHPLLFHPLSQVSDSTYQQRCVVKALREGIAIYSAHTSLDNAPGGVNHRIAELLGLRDLQWLEPRSDGGSGSGLIGSLPEPMEAGAFFARLKQIFKVEDLRHSDFTAGRMLSRIALCGGAGAFLMQTAAQRGADCFITGELHYHDWFESGDMLLAELGHYQSEQYTIDLLCERLSDACPGLRVVRTELLTDPVKHL